MTSPEPTETTPAQRVPIPISRSGFVLADLQLALDQFQLLVAETQYPWTSPRNELQSDLDRTRDRLGELITLAPEHLDRVNAIMAAILDDAGGPREVVAPWPTVAELDQATRALPDARPTIEDLARLLQLTLTVREDSTAEVHDALGPVVAAQSRYIFDLLASQPTMPGPEKQSLRARFDLLLTNPVRVLSPWLSEFGDWRYGLDPFDLHTTTLPADVALYDSVEPDCRYLSYAGSTIPIKYTNGIFEVQHDGPIWTHPVRSSFDEAVQTGLETIARWRTGGYAVAHRADGVHRTRNGPLGWQRLEYPPHDLRTAHTLYQHAATHLRDAAIGASGLDEAILLAPAARAATSDAMREHLHQIAALLRQHAHNTATGTNGAELHRIADILTDGLPIAGPGDYVITFTNAIKSRDRETAIRHDRQSALDHAHDHRPYNNTRVRVEQVISAHFDGNRTETIHTAPHRPPAPPPSTRRAIDSPRPGGRVIPPAPAPRRKL